MLNCSQDIGLGYYLSLVLGFSNKVASFEHIGVSKGYVGILEGGATMTTTTINQGIGGLGMEFLT